MNSQRKGTINRGRSRALSRTAKGILNPVPLHKTDVPLSCVPFFIITSGRSGSTLLRAVLAEHEEICIPPESHVLGSVLRKFKSSYRFLPWSYIVRLVTAELQNYPEFVYWDLQVANFLSAGLKTPKSQRSLAKLIDSFYMYYAQEKKPQSTRWGDKSIANTFYLHLIAEVFPRAKYIHLIRDGRDVAASWVLTDWSPNVQHAGTFWLRSVEHIRRFGSKLDSARYLEVFYEEFVNEPAPVVRRICSFLDLEYKSEMLNYQRSLDSLGDAKLKHHSNLKQPVNGSSIGKWQKQLSHTEQDFLREMLKDKLLELNYQID